MAPELLKEEEYNVKDVGIMLSINQNWISLIKPSKLICDNLYNNKNIALIVAEPLERGFGLTVGNALRRILLSSLRGAAITSVKIPGVLHDFSSIPGVREDVVDIILNLKLVAIRMHSVEHKVVRLSVVGPCVVTAGMIETGDDVEVLNPEAVICTLAKGVQFEAEFTCEAGKGYVQANRDNDLAIGVIPIDALFSPVKKVSYKVEDTRVGQITDYDRLVMTVETNGAIAPEMAVALASRILQDQLQLFITFEEEEEVQEKLEELPFNPILLKKVDELELSVRSQNCLKNDNIVYIGDLVIKTEAEMLRTANFGRKSLNEMKEILAGFGLKFGMSVLEWPPENLEDLAKHYEDPY